MEAAIEAEIGELTGPVEVQEGYSIFKVLSRERKRETFAEAEMRVRSQLRRHRYRNAFNELHGATAQPLRVRGVNPRGSARGGVYRAVGII